MKDQFVTYEIALRLKELGFNESCLGWYSIYRKNLSINFGYVILENLTKAATLAPLWQQAQRWLREVHHIHIGIWYNTLTSKYRWEKNLIGGEFTDSHDQEFDTYELALSEGLTEALKLLS